MKIWTTRRPSGPRRRTMKWDGEWHITFEVFRDLGLAFAVVLVLIYILVVGWFRSFLTPLRRHGRHPLLPGGDPARALGSWAPSSPPPR